jgi:hypothetical protein
MFLSAHGEFKLSDRISSDTQLNSYTRKSAHIDVPPRIMEWNSIAIRLEKPLDFDFR